MTDGETQLAKATVAELRLLLTSIERLGSQWTRRLPSEAAKEAAIHVRFDPNLWDALRIKYKDYRVDTVGDLVQIRMLLERIIHTLETEGKPLNLTLAKSRNTAEREQADLRP